MKKMVVMAAGALLAVLWGGVQTAEAGSRFQVATRGYKVTMKRIAKGPLRPPRVPKSAVLCAMHPDFLGAIAKLNGALSLRQMSLDAVVGRSLKRMQISAPYQVGTLQVFQRTHLSGRRRVQQNFACVTVSER